LQEYEAAAHIAIKEKIMNNELLVKLFESLPVREDGIPPIRLLFEAYQSQNELLSYADSCNFANLSIQEQKT